MLRAFATWFAKWKYVYSKEVDAGLNTWSARVAEQNAKMSREILTKLKVEADAFEARIKHVAEMEETGFWLCENGHEHDIHCACAIQGDAAIVHSAGCPTVQCSECGKRMKLIKRSEMTGQEKYESDRDRHEAEKLLATKRQEITEKETEAGQQDATAKYFRQQAASARALADSIRKL